jgi:hypothetical protein
MIVKTGLEHAATAIILQVLIGLYLYALHSFSFADGVLSGGIAACVGFLFREIAQHEYKGGGAGKVPFFYGLTNHWTLDSVIDIVFPIISTGVVWLLILLV